MTKKKIVSKEEEIKQIALEMLLMMDIPASAEVTLTSEGVYLVNIETEESGLLIGYHGETLASFQLLLGQIVTRKIGEWTRVVVEVGDYRAKREEQLIQMAQSYADQVVQTGQEAVLPYLPPLERRIIHMAISERSDVFTESEGEGEMRRVVIKPKN